MNRRGFLAAIGLAPVAAVSMSSKASEPVTVTVAASFDNDGRFAAVVAGEAGTYQPSPSEIRALWRRQRT